MRRPLSRNTWLSIGLLVGAVSFALGMWLAAMALEDDDLMDGDDPGGGDPDDGGPPGGVNRIRQCYEIDHPN
jgi:hypothetical protein